MSLGLHLGLRLGAGAVGAFSPASLFAAGEQGYWLDPSDFTTMFQDTAGTTPVTAVGQSVRRINDKSGRGNNFTQANVANAPILGVEPAGGRRNLLERTEEFNNAYWSKFNATVTADAGPAPNGTTTADALFETTANNSHSTFRASSVVSGGTYTVSAYVKANGRTKGKVGFTRGVSPFDGFEVGFDLVAETVTPTTLGVGTITNSGIVSVGNGWYRVFGTGTSGPFTTVNTQIQVNNDAGASIYVGDPTKGLLVWGAQLETGTTATAYQRVVTAFDVTEAGVPDCYYLSFDGTDDWLQSAATIDPGAVDKAQVFAGVRKLSDAAIGEIVESSVDAGANNGGLALFAEGFTASNGFEYYSRGTSVVGATVSSVPAPITKVITGISDISASSVVLRLDGAQVATNTASQGTGNYLTYLHYIGRRAGATFPFNGRVYQMVTRYGANLTAGQITQTETFVNSKTGAY